MKIPVSISVDLSHNVGYVVFRELFNDETVHGARIDRGVDVVVDRDKHGSIVGIELLRLDPETLAAARAFAHSNELTFPQHLDELQPV